MDNKILDIAIHAISETLLRGRPPRNLPDILKNHSELNALFSEITELQKITREIAGGNLDQPILLSGMMAGALKSLQASLRHLTWQTQRIAEGDFGHRVEFMGEFSNAFNRMVRSLADAKLQIETREVDLRIAYKELQDAKTAAESASRAKSEFLANMGHEVRTPLNAIIGFTHLAMSEEISSKRLEYLNKILQAGNSLLEIFNDILEFAKIEAGYAHIAPADFILNDVMQRISNSVRQKAEEKKLKFRYEISEKTPSVLMGDPLKLSQVLKQLTSNALKFTETGEVGIFAEPLSFPEEGRVKLKFSVKDTGVGIPDKIPLLFNAFTQADGSLTRRFGGTGLGLVICKRLTEMMGGDIRVESTLGRGSTFTFTAEFGYKHFPHIQTVTPLSLATTYNAATNTETISEKTDQNNSENIAQIISLLSELESFLNAGDFDAVEYMDKIKETLAASLSEDRIGMLENHIREYEFEKAAEVSEEIRKSLQ